MTYMSLPSISKSSIAVKPIAGPYSNYLGSDELAVLIAVLESVAPKIMIEFGCNDGRTAKLILERVHSIEKYIGIDVARPYKTTLKCQQTEVPLIAGYHAASDPRFVLIEQDSKTISDQLEPCDAVFIDADHSVDGVLNDSEIASRWLRPGGVITWHDYGNPAVEVTDALDYLHDHGWPIVRIDGTWLAMLRHDEVKK